MAKIRLTKEFRFEAAHALLNYDGLCKNIHGHSYILRVTVKGEPITDINNTKLGMVMDFGDLKRIVKKEIVDVLDHSVVLNEKAPHQTFTGVKDMFDRIHLLDYQPTCENMVVDFAKKIKKELPNNIELFSIQLYETATSYAEWFAEDNN
jgi:6-pyruvoyltetrahydropterin/6-carboxytetrahydropterin synthase